MLIVETPQLVKCPLCLGSGHTYTIDGLHAKQRYVTYSGALEEWHEHCVFCNGERVISAELAAAFKLLYQRYPHNGPLPLLEEIECLKANLK